MNRRDGPEVHRVGDGLRWVELGIQRLGRVNTVRKKTIYRSTLLESLVGVRAGVGYLLGGRRVEKRKRTEARIFPEY